MFNQFLNLSFPNSSLIMMDFRHKNQPHESSNAPIITSPSPLPCCHTHFQYSSDTPIKLLLTHHPYESSSKKPNDLFDRAAVLNPRPLSSQTMISTPPQKSKQLANNLNHRTDNQANSLTLSEKHSLQTRITDLLRQLQSEKAINKLQSEKINQLTGELAGSRARANFLSEDMKKMKGSMQEELDRLKREVERLMREKIQLQILVKNQRKEAAITQRKKSYNDSMEKTAVKKTSNTDPKRNASNQTYDSQAERTSNFTGVIEFKKRSDSAQNRTPIRKEMSSVLLNRKQLPLYFPSQNLTRKPTAPSYGKNLHSFWQQAHSNNHLIMHK